MFCKLEIQRSKELNESQALKKKKMKKVIPSHKILGKNNKDEKILKVAGAGGGWKLYTERQSKNHRILTENNISKKTWSNIFKILNEKTVDLKFYIQWKSIFQEMKVIYKWFQTYKSWKNSLSDLHYKKC